MAEASAALAARQHEPKGDQRRLAGLVDAARALCGRCRQREKPTRGAGWAWSVVEFGESGCGDRKPWTVADRVPKLTPHLVTERQDELNFQL